MSTISQNQLIRLSGVAKAAWVAKGKPGFVPAARNSTKAFDFWRKVQLCGVTTNAAESWKDVRNSDFEAVEAHFAKLSGDAGREFNAEKSKLEQPRLRMLATISQALTKCARVTGHDKWCLGYARTIARSKYKVSDLDDLTMGQLRGLMVAIMQATRKAIAGHVEPEAEGAPQEFDSEEAVQAADADAFAPEREALGV